MTDKRVAYIFNDKYFEGVAKQQYSINMESLGGKLHFLAEDLIKWCKRTLERGGKPFTIVSYTSWIENFERYDGFERYYIGKIYLFDIEDSAQTRELTEEEIKDLDWFYKVIDSSKARRNGTE